MKRGIWRLLVPATKKDTDKIMAKLSELAAKVTAVADQVDKVKTEVQKLKDSLADVDLPPEAQAALDRLAASVQAVDDINPDV